MITQVHEKKGGPIVLGSGLIGAVMAADADVHITVADIRPEALERAQQWAGA